MVEVKGVAVPEIAEGEVDALRIYEIGYHVSPSVKEDEVEATVGELRRLIEQEGGSLIAEGAPSLVKLAYQMSFKEGGARADCDRGYFGWIKFESPVAAASVLSEALKTNPRILRSIVFRTVREETRARLRPPTLREVRRTDTLKAAPRRAEEASAPVSEAELEKALEHLTAE